MADEFQPYWQQVEYFPGQGAQLLHNLGNSDLANYAAAFPTPAGGQYVGSQMQGPSIGYGYVSAPGMIPGEGGGWSTTPPPGGFNPTQINAWGNQPGGLGGGVGLTGAGPPGFGEMAAGAFTPNTQGIYSGDVEGGASGTALNTPTPELGTPDPLSTPAAPTSDLSTPTTIDMPAASTDNLSGGGGYPGLSDSLAGSQFGGSLSDAGLMRNLIAALLTNRGGGGGAGGSPWGGGGSVGGLFGGGSGLGGRLGV